MTETIINKTHNVVDIIHDVIPYNGLEAQIIENPIFARLQRVFQSSLAYMTYPSNKVHRYEHSIGVMHLAGKFFYHSIVNSNKEDYDCLFNEIKDEVVRWLNSSDISSLNDQLISVCKEDIKNNIPADYFDGKFFREITPSNISDHNRLWYYIVLESIRLTGLLHDVGHMPYSHITEFALERLFHEMAEESGERNEHINYFLEAVSPYCGKNNVKTQIHEAVGVLLVKKIFKSILDTIPRGINKEYFFINAVFHLTEVIIKSEEDENTIFSDLHRIVDGMVDCDRMDYCCRDLYAAGISKELPRYERIFYTVAITYKEPPKCGEAKSNEYRNKRCYFAYTSKAIGQIESLLSRRWEDFTAINYHHNVHKHELLLELVIAWLGKKSLTETKNTEFGITKGLLPFEISSIWGCIDELEKTGSVERIITQLDDEWLNTLLKYKYYEIFGDGYEARTQNHNNPEWNMLDELVTGQNHYRSLFKRRGGFERFDRAFFEKIDNVQADYSDFVNDQVYFFDKKIQEIKKKHPDINYYYEVEKRLKKWIATGEAKRDFHIIDCIIDENDFSLGIKAKDMESIYIISSDPNKPTHSLLGRTPIQDNLEKLKSLFPSFHIFYLPEFNNNLNEYYDIDVDGIQMKIICIMAECMQEILNFTNK